MGGMTAVGGMEGGPAKAARPFAGWLPPFNAAATA